MYYIDSNVGNVCYTDITRINKPIFYKLFSVVQILDIKSKKYESEDVSLKEFKYHIVGLLFYRN